MQQPPRDVIYIVDADAAVREGLSRLADSAGLEARPCDGIAALLRQAPAGCRACIVVDVLALWSNERTAGLRAAATGMPIIALSADDDPAARRRAREAGAQAFFRKPVDAAALLDTIAWVLRSETRD